MIKNEYVYRPSPIFDIRLPYYREVLSLVGTDIQISTGKRQIAVVDLTCPRTFVRQNLTVPIKVTVENQGVYPETANITVFASSTPLSSQTCWLDIGDSLELNCDWNTAGFAYGNYTLEAMATLLEQANTSSGYSGGWIIVSDPPVASFNWSPSLPRTSESITFDALSSSAGWNDTNTLVLYSWDFGDGNITVTPSALTTHVYAVAMAYDVSLMVTDSGDMTDLTWREVRVKVMGDINNDDTVNMGDIVILVNGFGSYPGHSRWNTVADLDQNQRIDLHDIVIALLNFGKTYRT
jgi:PKD repeat protein